MSDDGTRVGDAPSHNNNNNNNNEYSHVHNKSNHNYKPHVFHLNLPSHFMDPNDQIPLVTKFGHSKLQQLIDLIFSIQLTESMFWDDHPETETENDTTRVATSDIAVANDDETMEEDEDLEEEDDTEAVVPFGDTDVTIPTTTLLQVCKRCARIVALLSTIESLKCSLFTNSNTTLIMRLVLHLLRLVTATITYEVVVDRSSTDGSHSSATTPEPLDADQNDTTTSPKLKFRAKRPKLHFENVGTILQFHNHDRTTNGHHDEYDAFTPATSEEQLEQELHNQPFALPTPTREVLFTAIIHLLSNKKGVLRSVSNTSIYSDHDDTENSNYNRSLLIIHWEVLLRLLLRTAPYLNEHQTSMPVLDSNSHTNTIIKRTVQLIRHSRRFFEQGIRPPNYYSDDPKSSNVPKLDQTARAVWNMVQHDVLYQSHTHACYRGAILLYLFLPSRCSTEFYVSTLLPNYWTAWTNIDRMDEYDYLWLTLYCRARKYVSYDSYSDGWDNLRKRIITHCQYWFQLPIGGTSYDTTFPRVANPRSRTCPSKLKIFVGNGSGSSSYYDEAMDFIAKITKLLVTGLGAGKLISSSSDDETTVDKTQESISEGTNDMLLFLAYATPYFNPSNMGQWTATLGAFLHYFSYELCCRIGSAAGNSTLQQSHPDIIKTLHRIHTGSHCSDIPAHEVVLLLNTLLPLCQQTLYSKNSHVGRAGEAAMLYLVQIDPIHTTPSLVDFTCRALDVVSINLSHQAPAAMSALTRLIQPALRCDPHILLSRLPNILHLTLAGIDCNDQNKAIRTLIFYRSLLCWMPIGLGHGSIPYENDSESMTMKERDDGTIQFGHDLHEILSRQRQSPEYKAAIEALPSTSLLKQGRSGDNEVTPEMQKLFREEALSSLSDWSLEFLDRIFELLRASGDREKKAKRSSGVASRHTSADVHQARNFSRVLKETLSQLFACMDNETHALAIRTVYKFLAEETLPSAAKDASLLCQAAAASRSGEVISPGLDMLIPLLCGELSSHSMKTVTYRLRCLSGAVRSASHSVVKHRQMISTAITFALQSDDRYLFKTGCKLLRHTLTTLVEPYPHSYNFCPRGSDSAGNWFLGKSAELRSDFVQWHVPNRESMQFACSLIHNHVIEFLNSFVSVNLDSGGVKRLGTMDINDLRRCLRVIRYSIRGGASVLHDSQIDTTCAAVIIPYEAATNAVLHFVDDNVRHSICAVRGRISGFLVVLASIIASETFHPSGLNDLPFNDPCRKAFSTISSDPKICKETTDLSSLLLTRRGSAYRSQEAKTIWEAQKQVTCDFLLTSLVDQIFEVLQYAAKYEGFDRVLYKDGEGGGKTIPRRLLVSRAQLFHDTLQRNSSFEIPRRLRIVERNASTVRTRLFNVKSNLSEMVVNMDGILTLSTKSPLDGYEGIADCLYALCCHSNAQVRSSALGVIDYTMTRFGWLVAIRVPRLLLALSLGDEGMNGRFGVPSFCALSNDVNQQGRRKKLADAVTGVCSILSLSRATKHILQSERLRYQFTTTICDTETLVSLLPTEELQKMVHYMQSVFSQFRSRVYFLPKPSVKEKEHHYFTLSFAMDILSEKNGENGKPNGENGTGVHWRKRLLACWFLLTFIDDDASIDLSEPITGKAWSTCIRILELEKGQPLQRVGLGLFGRLVHLTTNRNTVCHPLLQEKMASRSFCRTLGEALVFDHREDTNVSGGHDAQWATGVEDIIRDAARSIAPRNIFPFQRTNQASGDFKPSHSQLVELVLATVDSETANTTALHLLEFANDMVSSPPSEDQRNQQITAAEIFGGICGSFFRLSGQTYRFKWHDVLQSHLEDGIGKIAFALSGAYFDSLRYALQSSPPEKVVPLTNWVIDKLLTILWQPPRDETLNGLGKVLDANLMPPVQGTEGFTTQSKWLYLFTAVLTEIDDSVVKVAIHGFWYKASLLSDVNAGQKLQVSDDHAVLDSWRSIFDSVLPSILTAVGHPFDSCRDHIARCLFRICFCSRKLSRFRSSQSLRTDQNSNLFPDPGLEIVEALLSLEKNSDGMAFVERYNAISTARRFVSYCVQLGEARFEYSVYIIPLLRLVFEAINPTIDDEILQIGSENPEVEAAKRALEAEVIKSCKFTLAEVSVSVVISYGDDTDQKRILDVIATACKHESWQVRQAAIHFLRCFQGAHKFQFSPALTERTMLIIAEMLTDERREVCSAAMAALTGLLASSPSEIVGRLVQSYIHVASSSLLPIISKKANIRNSVIPEKVDFALETKRAQSQKKSVFFLCAAITAQPYETPPFVPAALAAISKHSFERNAPLSVRDAVKRCCADYKKNHMSDNWESHRTVFSQEQLEALEDVSKSQTTVQSMHIPHPTIYNLRALKHFKSNKNTPIVTSMSTLQLMFELRARKLATMAQSDNQKLMIARQPVQNGSNLSPVQSMVRKPEERNGSNLMLNVVTTGTPNHLTKRRVPIANCTLAASYAPARTKRSTYNVEREISKAGSKNACNELQENRLCDKSNSRWFEFYNVLKEFQNTNGHCVVPSNYEVRKLACWVILQRRLFRLFQDGIPCSIDRNRIDMLNELGFTWDAQEASWERQMDELRAFHEKYGTCNVLRSDHNHRKLYRWMREQRRIYRDRNAIGRTGGLSDKRLAALKSVGFSLDFADTIFSSRALSTGGSRREPNFSEMPSETEDLHLWLQSIQRQYEMKLNTKETMLQRPHINDRIEIEASWMVNTAGSNIYHNDEVSLLTSSTCNVSSSTAQISSDKSKRRSCNIYSSPLKKRRIN